jgi:hypothetical protein
MPFPLGGIRVHDRNHYQKKTGSLPVGLHDSPAKADDTLSSMKVEPECPTPGQKFQKLFSTPHSGSRSEFRHGDSGEIEQSMIGTPKRIRTELITSSVSKSGELVALRRDALKACR